MLKENSKNKKVLNLKSILAVLTGGVVLMSSTGCSSKQNVEDESSIVTSIDNSSDIIDSTIGGDLNTSNSSNSDSNSDSTSSSNSSSTNDSDVEPVYKDMKAEDVITLSDSFCKYLNEFAKLSDKAYVFSELKPGDLYSIIYLSNIDNINKEETQKLIDADIINENIKVNIVNAFKVSNLIRNDASNKMITAYNNKEKVSEKDFIDLSLILTDEDDIEAFKVMRQIMVEAVNNPEARKSNYKDLVYYYIMGENLYDDSYDYSKSVFKTDRSSLTVGGDYLLRNMAYSIIDINKATKTDNAKYNKMLDESLSNVANIMQVFDNKCSYEEETSKTLVK